VHVVGGGGVGSAWRGGSISGIVSALGCCSAVGSGCM